MIDAADNNRLGCEHSGVVQRVGDFVLTDHAFSPREADGLFEYSPITHKGD